MNVPDWVVSVLGVGVVLVLPPATVGLLGLAAVDWPAVAKTLVVIALAAETATVMVKGSIMVTVVAVVVAVVVDWEVVARAVVRMQRAVRVGAEVEMG